MFCIIDARKNMCPIKSGFKTFAQANAWCKRNLPIEDVRLWGQPISLDVKRYFVMQK